MTTTSPWTSPRSSPISKRRPSLPISEIGPLLSADEKANQIFDSVKNDVLKKIWDLHKDDVVHNLNEVWKLEHIQRYEVISYRVEDVPHGVNFYAKESRQPGDGVLMNDMGDCVHVRAFRPFEDRGPVRFHTIQTRPSEEGGAVFTLEEPLRRFEY